MFDDNLDSPVYGVGPIAAILANRPDPKPTERPGLAIARQRWAEQEAAAAKKQQENDSNA